MKLPDKFVFSTPTRTTIVMTREFAASPAKVFAAWTQSEHIKHWWDPTGRLLRRCEVDLRVGGRFSWINDIGADDRHSFSGVYRAIEGPGRLVFEIEGMPGAGSPVATLTFRGKAKRTSLVMTIECASRRERDALLALRIDVGTAMTLENLSQHLEADDHDCR